MNRVVDGVEQLGNLVDAEERIGVEDERDNDFAGGKSAAFEGSVAGVSEDVSRVGTPDSGTVVPGPDGGFATLWARSVFPRSFTAPLDLGIERLWA